VSRFAETVEASKRQDQHEFQQRLHELAADKYADPLGYVLEAYDWPINGQKGPEDWQAASLNNLEGQIQRRGFDGVTPVLPIRQAISSGHGAGKTAYFGWIVDFLMSTRRNAQGSVTANTSSQLEFKTWAGIRSWTQQCLFASWFEINSTIMYRKGCRATWFCTPLANDENKADAFQGQHAPTSTSFYLVDEASGLGQNIATAVEGGLTDGEPWVLLGGNMLRNTGVFYETVYGRQKGLWPHQVIDTRTIRRRPALIDQWASIHDEDSDFFRVRVRGLAPRASELQYIDKERVDLARVRVQPHLPQDPLVAGFDVSGGGAAWNVIRFRRGLNGRVKAPIRIPGSEDKDRSKRVAICAELLNDTRPDHQLAALFVDSAFGSPIVATLQAMGHTRVHEVNFGAESPDIHQENQRAYMYARTKEWLLHGSIPDDDNLCDQLIVPGYHVNKRGKLVLESKKDITDRGELSPDDADAVVLTFAQPVAPRQASMAADQLSNLSVGSSWMGA
jgi:hypothetical protein